jgi:hypothetical protein
MFIKKWKEAYCKIHAQEIDMGYAPLKLARPPAMNGRGPVKESVLGTELAKIR